MPFFACGWMSPVRCNTNVEEREGQMNPSEVSRRTFVGALGAQAALTALSRPVLAAKGPNEQVVRGMMGVGSQGTSRLREFLRQADVRIGAICDVDKRHLDRAVAVVEQEKE